MSMYLGILQKLNIQHACFYMNCLQNFVLNCQHLRVLLLMLFVDTSVIKALQQIFIWHLQLYLVDVKINYNKNLVKLFKVTTVSLQILKKSRKLNTFLTYFTSEQIQTTPIFRKKTFAFLFIVELFLTFSPRGSAKVRNTRTHINKQMSILIICCFVTFYLTNLVVRIC